MLNIYLSTPYTTNSTPRPVDDLPRLPKTLTDEEEQNLVKREQAEAIRRLQQTGDRIFSLPVDWLPEDKWCEEDPSDDGEADEDSGDEVDDSGGRVDPSEDTLSDSGDEEQLMDVVTRDRLRSLPLRRQRGASTVGTDGKDFRVGGFAFFTATSAPFLFGKIQEERDGDDGEREVSLHWYTPSKKLDLQASTVDFDVYEKARFTANFSGVRVVEGKKVWDKDESWEAVTQIVASCDVLKNKGKGVPAWILKRLKDADSRALL